LPFSTVETEIGQAKNSTIKDEYVS
jgi:hypothetical protein